MKLLIVTQKVNAADPILGFFHEWIKKFSKLCDQVTVICLEKGQYNLPRNVRVLSLGKEAGSRSRFVYLFRFYSYIFRERKNYDMVFVHMNPVYVAFGGLVWKLLCKRIALWYTHKHVDLKLRVASLFADIIFSASKESFRLKSRKLHIVGHGIDVQKFVPLSGRRFGGDSGKYEIISVGRISATKNQLIMIRAIERVSKSATPVHFSMVGSGLVAEDHVYEEHVKQYVGEHKLEGVVSFVGNIGPADVVEWYQKADLFLNLSATGSLDKAVLEAMACGCNVLTSNEAFKNIVSAENFTRVEEKEIASKVTLLLGKETDPALREYVVKNHNIVNLIPELIRLMNQVR